jgi:hypothetical protein
MLGSVLNTILIPFYLVCVIFLIVLSLVTRIVYEVGRFLEGICDFVGDACQAMVDAISSL